MNSKNYFANNQKVSLLLEFYDTFGRWPKQRETYKDVKLGMFTNNVKSGNNKISDNDRKLLESKGFFISTNEKKHNKVLLLLEFFDIFGRWPMQKDVYKDVKLGVFANEIKYSYIRLSTEDFLSLKDKGFFNNKTIGLSKHDKVLLLLEFYDTFGRWPKQKETYNDIKLGMFARDVKYSKTKISDNDRKLLESKGFFNSNNKDYNKVSLLLEFYDTFGRWPKRKETYKDIKLGIFAHNVKFNNTKVSDNDRKLLKSKGFFDSDTKHHNKVLLLLEFYDTFERWPMQKDVYKDIKLGMFANNVKFDKTKISDNDRNLLKSKGFFDSGTRHHKKILLLLEFYDIFGRWPKTEDVYKDIKLGMFANNIKFSHTKISDNDRKLLESKGFFNGINEKKHNKVLLLLEFFDTFKRWPKQRETYKGTTLGMFANNLKSKGTKISDNDRHLLESKEFFISTNEKKHKKVLLLLEFFDTFKRWPKRHEIYKDVRLGMFAKSIRYYTTSLCATDYSLLTKKEFPFKTKS